MPERRIMVATSWDDGREPGRTVPYFRYPYRPYRSQHLELALASQTPGQVGASWGNWDVLTRRLLDEASAGGGVCRRRGHGWGIEADDDWCWRRSLLPHTADHDDVTFVTNGELAEQLPGRDVTRGCEPA
jgi:hypothetical protein